MSTERKPDVTKGVERMVEEIDKTISTTIKEADHMITPVRQTALRRFPTLFIVLVTFGVAATFYGFERMITQWPWLFDRPWLILVIGLGILIGTGTLYKKLG